MRRHLILFVRAPAYGSGKRRLARDIGDLAALGFERLMLARLLRRLGRDRRWRLRIAVTPDRARYRQRVWPRGIPILRQGAGDFRADVEPLGMDAVIVGDENAHVQSYSALW